MLLWVNLYLYAQVNVSVEFQWVFVPNALILEKATGLAICPLAVAKFIRELHLDSALPGLVGEGSGESFWSNFWETGDASVWEV